MRKNLGGSRFKYSIIFNYYQVFSLSTFRDQWLRHLCVNDTKCCAAWTGTDRTAQTAVNLMGFSQN